jgi:hypothetical protein
MICQRILIFILLKNTQIQIYLERYLYFFNSQAYVENNIRYTLTYEKLFQVDMFFTRLLNPFKNTKPIYSSFYFLWAKKTAVKIFRQQDNSKND